jgi:hypothetical protein
MTQSSDDPVHRFNLDGVEARLKEDRSGVWEGGASSNDEAIQILGTFFQHLDGLASNGATQGEAREIIRFVVRENQQAIVWRRLLSLLAKHPVLAQQFKGLVDAKPLMLASETQEQFGHFIAALYPHLSVDERSALEQRILAIANEGEAHQQQARQHLSDSLLGALEGVELTTDAARARMASMRASVAANAQRESATLGFGQMTPEDVERMHRQGESSEERSARKRIEPTTKRVEQFGMQHSNNVPSLDEAESILSPMEDLVALLESTDESSLPGKLKDSAVATLAGSCAEIAKIPALDCKATLGKLVKKVLLLAASNRYPEANPEDLKQFDKGPGGGWPIPRIVAAEGLLALATGSGCTDTTIIQQLDTLVRDPSPRVRFPIARYATWVRNTQPAKMWEWLEILSEDESITVREACVWALNDLANLDAPRALTLIDKILESIPKDREARVKLAKSAVQVLTGWYVWKNEPAARAAIARITSNVAAHANQAGHIPFAIRDLLTYGAMEDYGEPAAIRGRAVELLRALSKQSCDAVRSHLENGSQDHQFRSGGESSARSLFSLANIVASELYFGAGAFQQGRVSLPAVVTRPEQPRLYWEAESVFNDLSSIGFPALAHRLVETLEMYIDTDPRGVFLRLAAIVSAGKRWNFEYEQLAQDVVLRIVRRYLADKRALLQDDEECQRALREILETFIEAGWPAAQQLAYRIDEIHR